MRIKLSLEGGSWKNSPAFNSEEELESILNLDEIDNYSGMIKEIKRGNMIYAFIEPYSWEIDDVKMLVWFLDPEEANEYYINACDDI